MTRLGAISITNGYSTDYGLVAEWKLTALEESDYPALVFQDDRNDVLYDGAFEFTQNVLKCRVSIFARGTETPKQLRNMIQDVYRCLGTDSTCNGYANDIKVISDDIQNSQKDNVYGTADVLFEIYYRCQQWNLTTK
jgi:hypothetical protein